MDPTEYSIC